MSQVKVLDLSPLLKERGIVQRDVVAFMIDGLFSDKECQNLIAVTEAKGYDQALLNIGFGKQKLMTEYRNSDRCIIDDFQMADKFWAKIRQFVPNELNGYDAVGLNERMRFLRYTNGNYFKPHMDGSYIRPDGSQKSLITFFLFLNEGCQGGASTFLSMKDEKNIYPCVPKTGRLIIFEHGIYHEGSLLESGLKYALRTDVMFEKKTKALFKKKDQHK